MMKLRFKEIFQSFVRAYIYGSMHTALVGGFCYYLLSPNHNAWGNVDVKMPIIFALSIFSYYNICRIVDVKNYDFVQKNELLTWVSKNLTELVSAMVFSIFIFGLLFSSVNFNIPLYHYPLFYLLFTLILIYFPLRKIQVLRNLIIGFSWSSAIFMFEFRSLFDFSFYGEMFLYFGLYCAVVSFFYDKCKQLILLFLVDLFILIPVLVFHFIMLSMAGLD